MRRLDSASAAIADALSALPVAGEPGHSSPADLAAGLASIFRKRLGPCERLTVASAAMLALDPDSRRELVEAAERCRKSEQVFRRVGRKHRPPPLTKIEQRRAVAISFDDTPRETLAAAWAGASDRDRRDLVARVTGRAMA